jgi:hypothetical protein
VLIVGLGGEFGIHFAMRYIELAAGGRGRAEALAETAESIGGALFSSAVTTSLGFFLFILTDFTGVAQLGLISGAGMFRVPGSDVDRAARHPGPRLAGARRHGAVDAAVALASRSRADPLRLAHPSRVARAGGGRGRPPAAHPLRRQPGAAARPESGVGGPRSRSSSAGATRRRGRPT